MAERKYTESDWAVQRWDRFNARTSDETVLPLSFCHFWRTVILHETFQQLLSPARAADRLARRFKRFAPFGLVVVATVAVGSGGMISGENVVISLVIGFVLGTVLGFLVVFEVSEDLTARLGETHLSFWRGVGHGLWLLAWPFRTLFPPVWRRLVAGVVTAGEPVDRYVQRHKAGLETAGSIAVLVACVAVVGFMIVVLLISNWLVTLAVLGVLVVIFLADIVGIPQAMWRGFVAVMELLWGAAVAAKHGVCPPVTILRQEHE